MKTFIRRVFSLSFFIPMPFMETLAAGKYLRASTAQCFHRKCWSFVPWNGLHYSKQMTFKINKKRRKKIYAQRKRKTIDRLKGADQTRARVSIIFFRYTRIHTTGTEK